MVQVTTSQKKVKGKSAFELKCPSFWLGFQALNFIAKSDGLFSEPSYNVCELVKIRMSHKETFKSLNAISSSSYVIQKDSPYTGEDGKDGGYYNLSQVPFDMEVDKDGFALDYQVAILFDVE